MSDSIIPPTWTGQITSLCLALFLAVGISGEAAAFSANPQDSVRSLYNTLLTTMKDGAALGESGRYARLAPVVGRLFDVPLMAQLAVGQSWATLSATQQQQVTDAFAHYIAATYADWFDSYSGQQLRVVGEQPSGAQVIVQTTITKATGDSVTLNYQVRENGGWCQRRREDASASRSKNASRAQAVIGHAKLSFPV